MFYQKEGLFMFLWLRCFFRTFVVAAVVLAGSGIVPVAASHDHDKALQAVKSGEIRPLAEILDIVQDKLPGEVVRVKLEQKEKQWVYEFRVVDSKGQLFEAYVDARSGEIKRMRKK
ncbi:MAG: PepSY domain-containing protein [Burkholderiales bacterium]|nr:PepSY domain-containing protein [Burkholderiales bacterium]